MVVIGLSSVYDFPILLDYLIIGDFTSFFLTIDQVNFQMFFWSAAARGRFQGRRPYDAGEAVTRHGC